MHIPPREQQVLNLLCEGKTNKIIGRELGIATGTVKVHASRLFRRLGVINRTQAVAYALTRS